MSKRKLLLADDSITIQKVVNLTFADEGIEVIAVGDGDSAMRKFDEFMPDLVMADVNMPGLNGYEVCRLIKRTEETQHIPVILLVGSFEPFDENEAGEVGADDFLTKPFQSIRQLVNKVTDLLNRSTRAAEETQAAPVPVVDSFAETLEFSKDLTAEPAAPEAALDSESRQDFSSGFAARPGEISSEFGDAGMDDDMIEASPANEYVSGSDSVYQAETTIDYAKTQPLNAEDLKGFEMVSGTNAEQRQSAETYEIQQPITERRDEPDERSEPASFDEEARKLNQTEDYEDLQNYPESQNEQAPQDAETPEIDQETENISESEPQIDYYLPNEPEFEKELSDAETLAPEISFENEVPREADFSQSEVKDSNESGVQTEYSSEAPETRDSFAETESAGFDKTEPARESEAENIEAENVEAETPQTFAGNFAEEPETNAAAEPGTWEHPVNFSEVDEEPEKIEEAQTVEPENEYAKFEEPETVPAEYETAQTGETETEQLPQAESEEAQTESEESPAEFETTAEMPIFASEAAAPALDFDDGDLLELPPLVEETGIRPQPKAEALVPEVVAAAPAIEPESKITVTKTVAESEIALSFPPELIEAIAQAVAEKISARTMNDVLPQITELVMKKLAEDKKE